MKTLPKTFIQQVNQIIDQHLDDKQLLQLLEKKCQLSSSQIYRKIKQKTGHSPSIHVQHKRLQQAHLWIQQSDVTIAEIAKMVGFRQLAYFSRCFSKFYGYSPISLRKEYPKK